MQLQADVSGRTVERSAVAELSAFGAARLAAETVGTSPGVCRPAQAGGASSRPTSVSRDAVAWRDALKPVTTADDTAGHSQPEPEKTGDGRDDRVSHRAAAPPARPPPPPRAPWVFKVLVVVALIVAFVATKRVSLEEEAEISGGGFDAATYVDERWESEIVPALTTEANELPALLDALDADPAAAAELRQLVGCRQRVQLRCHRHRGGG